jgi:ketosteroid isomerase-like protein
MTDAGRAAALSRWVEGYVSAWNSNDPAEIGALFSEDAEYVREPYTPAVVGRDAIVADWLAHRDEPGETTFTWQTVALTDEVAVVRGETTYPGRAYSNLWLIRFDADGRCRSFTEFWMQHP